MPRPRPRPLVICTCSAQGPKSCRRACYEKNVEVAKWEVAALERDIEDIHVELQKLWLEFRTPGQDRKVLKQLAAQLMDHRYNMVIQIEQLEEAKFRLLEIEKKTLVRWGALTGAQSLKYLGLYE